MANQRLTGPASTLASVKPLKQQGQMPEGGPHYMPGWILLEYMIKFISTCIIARYQMEGAMLYGENTYDDRWRIPPVSTMQ